MDELTVTDTSSPIPEPPWRSYSNKPNPYVTTAPPPPPMDCASIPTELLPVVVITSLIVTETLFALPDELLDDPIFIC